MNQRSLEADHGAFSLLELLVCVAAATVLALMAFQQLGSLRQKSSTIKCATNLRELSVYIHQYGNDYNGNLLPTLQRTDSQSSSGITWMEILNQSKILPYQTWSQQNGSIMHCPARTSLNPRGYQNSLPSAHYNGLHYGMSTFPGVNNMVALAAPRNKLNAIRRPSQTVLLTEANWNYLIYPTLENHRIYPHKGCNLLFVDGHIQFHSGALPVYRADQLQPDAQIPPFMGSGE